MSKRQPTPSRKAKAPAATSKKARPARTASASKPAPAKNQVAAPVKARAKSAAKPIVKKASVKPARKKAVPKSAPKAKAAMKLAQKTVKKTAAKAPLKTATAARSKPKAVVATSAPTAVPSPKKAAPAAVKAAPPPQAVGASSSALYYDTHMHTPLCKHAWGEPEEYAEQGIRAGLKGIIFTCHCPMPDGFWPTVRMADSEFDTYLEIVARAAHAFEGRLDVRLGLESEFFPGMEPWIEKLHQRAEFDYILGGLHWQAREYLGKFETGTIEAFRKCYFNHLAESAETGLYDCLAHPDLVKNYHPDSWCLAIVKDSIAKALDRIAATGVAMELNTSGLNKSYSEMNPGLEMLRMMAERQIPVVIGSDAHRPHRVGEHFMTALSHLQEAGYDQVSHFLKRQRIDLKISAVQASIKKSADARAAG